MLDAAAAVLAVAPAQAPTAPLSASSSNPAVGAPVTLDASDATVAAGRSGTYQWTITAGASIASFTSATNATTATLMTSAAGTVTVMLTVTDNLGVSTSASTTMTVGTAAPPPATTPPPATSSGGGGALGLQWLLLLALAIGALAAPSLRRRG